MGTQIGNFAYIPSVAERIISGNKKGIIRRERPSQGKARVMRKKKTIDDKFYNFYGLRFPKTLETYTSASLDTGKFSATGMITTAPRMLISSLAKPLAKTGVGGVGLIAGGIGALFGWLLGGGGGQDQEQQQEQQQETQQTQQTTQQPNISDLLRLFNEVRQDTDQDATATVTGGYNFGRIASPSSENTSYNITDTLTNQDTYTYNIQSSYNYQGASQDATQDKGIGLLEIAIIGGVIVLATQ